MFLKKAGKVFLIVIIVAGIAVGGYYYKMQSTAAVAKPETVQTIEEAAVTRGDLTIDFIADGAATVPVTYADFEVSGKVSEILVGVGDEVKAGDILARVDETTYQENLKSAQNSYEQTQISYDQTKEDRESSLETEKKNLESIKEEIDQFPKDQEKQIKEQQLKIDDAKVQLEKTELDYKPMQELPTAYTKKEIENQRITYESAKTNYERELEALETLKEDLQNSLNDLQEQYVEQEEKYNALKNDTKSIKSAELKLESAEQTLENAKKDLENITLKAPADGTVMFISKKVGETVATDFDEIEETATSDTQHFMLLSTENTVYLETSVSEFDLTNVFVGEKAEVEFEAIEGQEFEGKVTEISPLPEIDNNGIVTYDVKIQLVDPSEEIRNGMTCTIYLIIRQEENVLQIPNGAVTMEDGKQMVQMKQEDGSIVSREIKAGFSDGENVEVVEGLTAGERVIIQR